ncbi:hypothetical protein FQZ97_670960 [compost metagenome]
MPVQPQLARGHGETLAQQIGPNTGSAHARTEVGIVAPPVAQVFDAMQHTLSAIGEMHIEPVLEQGFDLPRQAQNGVAGVMRASRLGRLEDVLHGFVVDERDDGRHQHAHRHAGVGQAAHGLQAAPRRGSAGLQRAGHAGVQRGDAHVHHHQLLLGQRRQQVQVAGDQPVFRHDGDRMPGFQHEFEQAPGQAPFALDRLVRIRGRPDIDRRRLVSGAAELGPQGLDGIGLGDQPGFEVQPGGIAQVGMRGPGVAIHAAVLAPPVRIDRGLEGDIRRIIARQHLAGLFRRDRGLGGGRRVARIGQDRDDLGRVVGNVIGDGIYEVGGQSGAGPAVVDLHTVIALKAMPNISNRTPTAQGGGGGSRGPRTGGKRMIGACHENHCTKTQWF